MQLSQHRPQLTPIYLHQLTPCWILSSTQVSSFISAFELDENLKTEEWSGNDEMISSNASKRGFLTLHSIKECQERLYLALAPEFSDFHLCCLWFCPVSSHQLRWWWGSFECDPILPLPSLKPTKLLSPPGQERAGCLELSSAAAAGGGEGGGGV